MPVNKSNSFSNITKEENKICMPSKILHVDNFSNLFYEGENYIIEYGDSVYDRKGCMSKDFVNYDKINVIEELDFIDTIMNLDNANDMLFETVISLFGDIAQTINRKFSVFEDSNDELKKLNLSHIFDYLYLLRSKKLCDNKLDYIGIGSACVKIYSDYVFDNFLKNVDKNEYLKQFEVLFNFSISKGYLDRVKNEIKRDDIINGFPESEISTYVLFYDIINEKKFIEKYSYLDVSNNTKYSSYDNELPCALGFISVNQLFDDESNLNVAMSFIEECFHTIEGVLNPIFTSVKDFKIFNYLLREDHPTEDELSCDDINYVDNINSCYFRVKNGDDSYFEKLLDNIINLFNSRLFIISSIGIDISSRHNDSNDGVKLEAINKISEISKVFIKYDESKFK